MDVAQPAKAETVYIIDDDRDVRTSLVSLLRSHNIVAIPFGTSNDFIQSLVHADPGCMLIDLRMPGLSGIDLIRHLRRLDCYWPSVVITGHGDISVAVEAIKLGAIEFLQKPFSEEELLAAVEEGFRVLPERVVHSRNARAARRVLSDLTPREMDVFRAIAAGDTNKRIAQELQISARTVESYRQQMMTKLGAERTRDVWAISTMLPEGQ
jgi:two-component system response regulator FixJ